MSDWNPRYLAYCRAMGQKTPEAMLAVDRERFPGGHMVGFMIFMSENWSEFERLYLPPPRPPRPFGSFRDLDRQIWRLDNHDAFDTWLQAKYPEDQ